MLVKELMNKVFLGTQKRVLLTDSEKQHRAEWPDYMLQGAWTGRRTPSFPSGASAPHSQALQFSMSVSKSPRIHVQFSNKDTRNKISNGTLHEEFAESKTEILYWKNGKNFKTNYIQS